MIIMRRVRTPDGLLRRGVAHAQQLLDWPGNTLEALSSSLSRRVLPHHSMRNAGFHEFIAFGYEAVSRIEGHG